jgi:hypothetical protein
VKSLLTRKQLYNFWLLERVDQVAICTFLCVLDVVHCLRHNESAIDTYLELNVWTEL